MSTKLSTTEKGQETAVGGKIEEDHPSPVEVEAMAVEEAEGLQTKSGAMILVEAILEEGVVEVPLITPQAHAVSVRCIKCLQKGRIATVCPFRVKLEQAYNTEIIDPSKNVWTHNGEIRRGSEHNHL